MIKHVLDPSFSQYGVTENSCKLPNTPLKCEEPSPIKNIPIYCYPFPTCWDRHSGMVVLLIDDNGKQLHFYLDRIVKIHAHVRFGFYSLEPNSSVTGDVNADRRHEPIAHINICKSPAIISDFRMYTLFRQSAANGLFFRGEEHVPLEFVYVEKGELHNFCDGEQHILRPKQFQIFGSQQWHMHYADTTVQFITISFTWNGPDFAPLLNRTLTMPADAQHSVQSLLRTYEQDSPDRDALLATQVQLLLLQILCNSAQTASVKLPAPASELMHQRIIDEAMQTVSECIYDKLTVSSLAARVNVSVSQLSFLFKNYLSTTPGKYITRIRLEKSKYLLIEQGFSVGETAEQLGYTSIQHFSKQFHDWYGCSPSTFIRQNRTHPKYNTD